MPPSKKLPKKSVKKNKTKSNIRTWAIAFFWAFIIILTVRLLVVKTYIINTSTMANTLLPGDWVVIEKLSYGPRLPITPISLPFTPEHKSAESPRYYVKFFQLPYFRLSGLSEIKHNDVIAFNYPAINSEPVDKKPLMIKRCVALPGDTVHIMNNRLFVNSIPQLHANLQFEYRLITKSKQLQPSIIEKYKLTEGGILNNYGEYSIFLTDSIAKKLRNEPSVRSLNKSFPYNFTDKNLIYPYSEDINWSLPNYGPLIVPKKGMAIDLTKQNIDIYRRLIEHFENNKLDTLNNKILVNNKPLKSYVFKQDYYFIMDDNRDNAMDSRFWGFLPESHIIGKASFVLVSLSDSRHGHYKINWKRSFSKIE